MTENSPFVSIVMPVRNEAPYIQQTLRTFLVQDYPSNLMQILLVDGMSTDNTRAMIQSFNARHPQLRIQLLENPGKIVPTGINLALRQAKGEIIIRVDGHTTIAPDYVRQCVKALQRTDADNAGGRMNAIGSNPFGKAVALATSTPFGIGGGRFHYSDKEEWVDTVYMGAWPRRAFEKMGLFDEELERDQDDEFNYRLRQHGGRILLSPAIRSEYAVRSTPRALWWQYHQYGFWKVRVLQKHPRQMSLRQFVPPVLVLSLITSAILALYPAFRLLSVLMPLCYLSANLLASFYTASKRGWRSLTRLPLVFAILHLSYGLGFLAGLVKFWSRWGDKTGKTPAWSSEAIG